MLVSSIIIIIRNNNKYKSSSIAMWSIFGEDKCIIILLLYLSSVSFVSYVKLLAFRFR